MKNYEIGGYFELDPKLITKDNNKFVDSDSIKYLSTGREAITYALRDSNIKKEKKIALISSYTCETVIKPFLNEGFEIRYYNYNKNMTIKISEINKKIHEYNPDVVLLQPLFGFNNIIEDESIDSKNVILDNTQNIFSKNNFSNMKIDYEIASIRKWVPLIDGGYIKKNNGILNEFEITDLPEIIFETGKESQVLRYQYLYENTSDKEKFLDLKKKFSKYLTDKDFLSHMTNESKSILEKIDIDDLKERRRKNYKTLLDFDWDRFGEIAFPEIKQDEVPLYFIAYITKMNRGEFLRNLYSYNIYPAVIWPKSDLLEDEILSDDVKFIYDKIVAFPIDQRYTEEDMIRIIDVLIDL